MFEVCNFDCTAIAVLQQPLRRNKGLELGPVLYYFDHKLRALQQTHKHYVSTSDINAFLQPTWE